MIVPIAPLEPILEDMLTIGRHRPRVPGSMYTTTPAGNWLSAAWRMAVRQIVPVCNSVIWY
jgi:hypothetical protein